MRLSAYMWHSIASLAEIAGFLLNIFVLVNSSEKAASREMLRFYRSHSNLVGCVPKRPLTVTVQDSAAVRTCTGRISLLMLAPFCLASREANVIVMLSLQPVPPLTACPPPSTDPLSWPAGSEATVGGVVANCDFARFSFLVVGCLVGLCN